MHFIESSSDQYQLGNYLPRRSTAEEAACKNHSEAERRRRKRINGHLATLRSLLPNTIKTDKASLLAEVVRRVGELNKEVAELAVLSASDGDNLIIPTEMDETKLSYCNIGDQSETIVKASVCCEDRPELVSELRRAVSSIKGEVVRAEMATVGGRTKSVLWVKVTGASTEDQGLTVLQRALKVVINKGCLLSGSTQGFLGKKRTRLSHY